MYIYIIVFILFQLTVMQNRHKRPLGVMTSNIVTWSCDWTNLFFKFKINHLFSPSNVLIMSFDGMKNGDLY